ncbi:HAMP domain-containing sensor histidine kinase [Telluria aromaticivorans]|uniref:histidine kinase n=1 Tax=Telluria aromaticivorans TaxID=2725995 RepID=A0A7Y2K2N5_9BURK|nr:ATP-binding protein [Telluria aromaticivorans]NNG25446.1 HAMP domain-containing protein [Telluria aromaticivorans]
MGRLFWKFFLCILLAQVAATIGIGGAFWLRDQSRSRAAELDTGPPAFVALDAAAATLKHGGMPALRGMVSEMKRPQIFLLDPRRRELLGRPVPPELLAEVDRKLASGEPLRGIRYLTGPGGVRYLAFVQRPNLRMGMAARVATSPALVSTGGRPPHGFGPGGFSRTVGQVFGIVAGTLASLLFAALLAWYFSRPIRALRSAFEAASAGDLAPRFTGKGRGGARGGDELSDLGRDFDRMSAQLRALMDGQRRLLHDVSHELRSPLARLQAAVGLAHQQPEKIASSLDRIERESMRMDKLVGGLLTLSRLEATPAIAQREQVDLAELMDEIVADARFENGSGLPGDASPSVNVEAPGPVIVQGDPDLLWSALENIVRNAIRHGGSGGKVRAVLRSDGRSAQIEVLDRGPGIAPADLASVFEPFFRSNPGANVDGHGLGLAIAQRVVLAHGGQIRAANRDGGGLQVTVSLPLEA